MVKLQNIIFIFLIICLSRIDDRVCAQKQNVFECKATYYHNMFENRRTSSGEIFSQKKYTAAHKTLPLHTIVKVTNLSNGRSVLVKVNDRCPKRGVIDLSLIAAKQILLHKTGTAKVKVEIVGENYKEILVNQDEILKRLDKENISDSMYNYKLDSIFHSKGIINDSVFSFSFYVRLCSINNVEDTSSIREQLSMSYKDMIKLEKVLNTDYYYVNIGSFLSIKLAEQALKDLKNTYKSAYIVKKK